MADDEVTEPFVGIDFGTTTSVVAWFNERTGQADIVLNEEGQQRTPSVVYFGHGTTPEESGDLVGELAEGMLDDLEERRRVVSSVKRDLVSAPTISLPGPPVKRVKPIEVAGAIFAKLKHDAEALHFHQPVSRAVVTYPASFDDMQQATIRQAAEAAGFSEVLLLAEPIAAALAYARAGYRVGDRVLVYDLGGGTFDVACLVRNGAGFRQALPPRGLARCGGDDFDYALYDYLDEQVYEELGCGLAATDRVDPQILRQCRRLKERLSASRAVTFSTIVTGNAGIRTFSRTLDLTFFERLIAARVESTVRLTVAMIAEAEQQGEPIDTVVLVGGSSQLPLVRRLLAGVLPPALGMDGPERWHQRDLAVALGAAYHAAGIWLAAPKEDHTPKSLANPVESDLIHEVHNEHDGALTGNGAFDVAQVEASPTIASLPRFELARTLQIHCEVIPQGAGARCALHPNGIVLAVTCQRNVTVWNLVNGAQVYTIPHPKSRQTGGRWSLAFSPDGRYLAVGEWSAILLCDAQTGKILARLKIPDFLGRWDSKWNLKIMGLCFRSNEILLAAQITGQMRCWDLIGKRAVDFAPDTRSKLLESMVLSQDGALLAAVSPGEINLWDVESGSRRHHIAGYGARVIAMSPDGRTLATDGVFTKGTPNNTIEPAIVLWDIDTGRQRRKLLGPATKLTMAAFHPEGRMLAVGSLHPAAWIWDAVTGEVLQTLPGMGTNVLFVAFLPDGHTLLTVHHESIANGRVQMLANIWQTPR